MTENEHVRGAVETSHVLFDFFGTLVAYSPSRTEQGYERSFGLLCEAGAKLDYDAFLALWSEVSAEFDEVAAQTRREFSMIELGAEFVRRVIDRPAEPLVRAFVQTYVAEWNKGVRYLEGLPALVRRLGSRYSLAVVSNTHDAELVPRHLEQMGIAASFRRVVTSVELGVRKPAPEIFLHALRLLEVDAARCVYVGDDYEADYRGARSAGIRCLLIDPHRRAPVGDADRLGSIFELDAGRLEA